MQGPGVVYNDQNLGQPNSSCIYVNLYCSEDNVENIISKDIARFMDATNQSYSVKWFFVRYGEDSNRHIRFRIFPENEADMGELTARIYKWSDGLADSNVIFSWSKER